jgi:hypothetical protein
MKQLIVSLLFLSNLIMSSQGDEQKKYIVFDKNFFDTQEANATKENPNPYIYQAINDDLYFNFIFISDIKTVSDYIWINALNKTDLIKSFNLEEMKDFAKHRFPSNIVFIPSPQEKLFTFYFETTFSENDFQIFKGCLSYASKNKRAVVIDQSFMLYFLDMTTTFQINILKAIEQLKQQYKQSINNLNSDEYKNKDANQKALAEKTLAMYFKKKGDDLHKKLDPFSERLAMGQPDSEIITIYVLLSLDNKQNLYSAIHLFLISEEEEEINAIQNKITTAKSPEDLNEITSLFNTKYQNFLNTLKITLSQYKKNDEITNEAARLNQNNTSMFGKVGNLLFAHAITRIESPMTRIVLTASKPFIDSLALYGFKALQLYSTVQTLRHIGSLRSFPQLPQTKIGQAKALWNVYSMYSTFSNLYGYSKRGLNWLNEKIYGSPAQKPAAEGDQDQRNTIKKDN